MSEPCWKCGVRPDVACRHRPANESWEPPDQNEVIDKYKPHRNDGAGHNFKTRKRQGHGGGRYKVKRKL